MKSLEYCGVGVRRLSRALVAVSTLIALGLAGCSDSVTSSAEVRIGHADTLQHSKHQAFLTFEHEVGPDFQVEIFPNGQLGSEREMIEQVQSGVLQVTSVSNGTLVPFAPEFQVLDIPFQFENYAQAKRVLSGDAGDQLLASLGDRGLVGLGFWVQGYRQLTTGDTAVRSVDDIAGLQIRTMQAPLHVEAFRALGASPTPMAWGEVYSALEQGVIDGQENPVAIVYDLQLYRVQDYVTLTAHVLDPMPVVANKEWFDNLTPTMQDELRSAIQIATDRQWELAEAAEVEGLRALREDTEINIIELSEEERAAFRARAQHAVVEVVSASLGEQATNDWMAAVEAAK